MAGTTKFTGEKATIKLGTSTVLKMNSWKLSVKATLVDTTTFDDEGWESNETATKSWELSLEGLYKGDDTTGQRELMKQLVLGGALETSLYIDKSSSVADFKGNIRVESLDVDTSVKGEIKVSIKAKGTGKLDGIESAIVAG